MRRLHYVRSLSAFMLTTVSCTTTGEPQDAGNRQSVVVRGDLHFTATTRFLESFPVQLHTTVDVTNRGRDRARLEFASGCKVFLRAYRTEARQAMVWDQARVLGCTLVIESVELAPGERRELLTRSDAHEILGDSLPGGRYYLGAFVPAAGLAIELPAGVADLAVPR